MRPIETWEDLSRRNPINAHDQHKTASGEGSGACREARNARVRLNENERALITAGLVVSATALPVQK